ncbi:hypothetical protein ACFE04_018400 [Oxalis oulophora]
MGKIWVEVCLISARGLTHSSFLWKLQWFAVGWIDPNNKYCTKIDAPGTTNPVWKTKFATLVDESTFHDMVLNVQVFSREPVFLRERLQGTATIVLKEFLAKYNNNSETSRSVTEEVGSYQLRKKNSGKPQGFVDVSIRISEEKEEPVSYPGSDGGFVLMSNGSNITLSHGGRTGSGQGYPSSNSSNITLSHGGRPGLEHGYPSTNDMTLSNGGESGQGYPSQPPIVRRQRQENHPQPNNYPHTNPTPYPTESKPEKQSQLSYPYADSTPSYPTGYSNPSAGPAYHPPRTPPPPPPPSNVGYIPTFLPRTNLSSDSYINMPSSMAGPSRRGPRPGFATGAAAGALAAGAVIFGDDFMSGFDIPSGFHDPSLIISTDPPF